MSRLDQGNQLTMVSYLLIPVVLVVVYILYKLVLLIRADADLTLLSKSLKRSYFQGKVVWVTGASSGIGEELCYQLSRLGAKLILTARSEDKLTIVRKGLSRPNDARILLVDLSDPLATRAATQKALAFFGRIDILINNAGLGVISTLADMHESTHRRLMEINLFAPWILTHDTLPGMLSNGFGHIVNMSSIGGKFGFLSTSYSSSKFGLMGLMNFLRYELADEKILVTNICPAPVRTHCSENAMLSDGSINNKKHPIIEQGMTVQRCCELSLIAVSNQLDEAWIGKQPFLGAIYLAQYIPSLVRHIVIASIRKEKAAANKNN